MFNIKRKLHTAFRTTLLAGVLVATCNVQAEIAVIVHPSNSVDGVSARDIHKLYMGRLQLFPGTSKNVVLLDQGEQQSSYLQFYQEIIKVKSVRLKRYRAAFLFSGKGDLPIKLDSDMDVKKYVASNENAVGYIDASLLDESVKPIFIQAGKE